MVCLRLDASPQIRYKTCRAFETALIWLVKVLKFAECSRARRKPFVAVIALAYVWIPVYNG